MAGNKKIGKIILGVLGVGTIATAEIASVVNNDNSKKKSKNSDDAFFSINNVESGVVSADSDNKDSMKSWINSNTIYKGVRSTFNYV